jgi:hypothetical protein
MKICSRCQEVKRIDCFGANSLKRDKLSPHCKTCEKKRRSEFHEKNKDARNSKARDRRKQNPELFKKYGHSYRAKYPWRMLISHARKRAAKFGWGYDLDDHVAEIKQRVSMMTCEMSGINLIAGVGAGSTGKRFFNTLSLDRVDPNKGYVYENIRIVSWIMNCSMNTWGEDILIDVMKKWISNNERK